MADHRNPTPVAVGIVSTGNGNYLGIIRREPADGIAFPGGYVDELETAEQAVSRELFEECGLVTTPEEWRPIATKVTPKNILLIFCELQREVNYGELRDFALNSEVKRLYLISRFTELCFSTHESMKRELFQ